MNRLQRKCFIASTGLHLFMAGILFVGPAFLSSPESKSEDVPIINFIPLITTDQNISGGGSPTGRTPTSAQPPQPERAPAPPAPTTRPERAPEPAPVRETRAEPPPEPRPSTRRQIQVSRNRIRTNPAPTQASRDDTRMDTARELRNQVSSALNDVRNDLTSSTSIELKGPGGGGVPYANWLSAVQKVYTDAWLAPEGVTDDSATVSVSVTIARDGKVIESRIVRGSGNSLVDSSVQSALKRVTRAPRLPADSNDEQRTVIINFNLKTKLLLG